MGTRTLHPSGAVQDGAFCASLESTYPSPGFRLAASPTGRARLRPPRSPRRKAQVHRKARTRFAGESRNCFPRACALRQGMKIAKRFSIIPLRLSGAVQDGMHRTSFVRAYPSLGFRLAASPTGRARLRPAKPLNDDDLQRVFPLCTPLASHASMVLHSV